MKYLMTQISQHSLTYQKKKTLPKNIQTAKKKKRKKKNCIQTAATLYIQNKVNTPIWKLQNYTQMIEAELFAIKQGQDQAYINNNKLQNK